MPKVWPVEFKLLNGWSLQLFSWSIDISIYAIQKNIKVKLLEHQMDENNLFTNANTSNSKWTLVNTDMNIKCTEFKCKHNINLENYRNINHTRSHT